MPNRLLLLLLLTTFMATTLLAQRELVVMHRTSGKVEVPFEYVNDFIIVEVIFNRVFPLKFIFDTGAEHTILTRKEFADLLDVNYQRKVSLYGADLQTKLEALVATGIQMEFEDQMTLMNQSILVMEADYFRFEEYAGVEVHGVMGADLLRRFVVSIDYRRKTITFEDPSGFKPPSPGKYRKVAADFSRHKPYLRVPAQLIDRQDTEYKLLMDSGAGLSLLLYTHADSLLQTPLTLIRTCIGHGLGGSLEGFVGRTASIQMGDLQIPNVITNFQDISHYELLDTAFLNNRNGLIGNKILNRFTIVIDYIREAVYLKPNRDIRKAFSFDRSGISVIASGEQLNKFTVMHVVDKSPAQEAGVRKGDEIRAVNGIPSHLMGLEAIHRSFLKKPGKRIRLLLRRNDERLVVEFKLRDLI
ncbi:MAG: aspartyl protease family protein [Saprospiraceae bacterium]